MRSASTTTRLKASIAVRTERLAAITLLFLTLAQQAVAAQWKEADYRNALCAGMEMEIRLADGRGRADCESDTHIIEVEYADKFKEGVGQALVYATVSEKIPGLILVCRKSESLCLTHSLAAQETFSAFGIEATVWECGADARALRDCTERTIEAHPL